MPSRLTSLTLHWGSTPSDLNVEQRIVPGDTASVGNGDQLWIHIRNTGQLPVDACLIVREFRFSYQSGVPSERGEPENSRPRHSR